MHNQQNSQKIGAKLKAILLLMLITTANSSSYNDLEGEPVEETSIEILASEGKDSGEVQAFPEMAPNRNRHSCNIIKWQTKSHKHRNKKITLKKDNRIKRKVVRMLKDLKSDQSDRDSEGMQRLSERTKGCDDKSVLLLIDDMRDHENFCNNLAVSASMRAAEAEGGRVERCQDRGSSIG